MPGERYPQLVSLFTEVWQTDPYISPFMILALLDVAAHPDTPIGEAAQRHGVSMSVMSACFNSLGSHTRYRNNKLEFVTHSRNPQDFRQVLVKLSPKGRSFIARLEKAVQA